MLYEVENKMFSSCVFCFTIPCPILLETFNKYWFFSNIFTVFARGNIKKILSKFFCKSWILYISLILLCKLDKLFYLCLQNSKSLLANYCIILSDIAPKRLTSVPDMV